jgi:hypothetical protein
MRRHVGVYQRPAPPKRPLGLNAAKNIQKPAIPLHEIEARASDLMEDMEADAEIRGPGRPAIYERAMTAAERQARRRARQSREQEIREARQIGDAHGKSRAEARSGGYDSTKVDIMIGLHDAERVGRHVRAAEGASSAADERASQEILNSGECDARRGGFEQEHEVQAIHVRGLRTGDDVSNRRLFAESELRRMVEEYFTSPDKTPSASWIAKHAGNLSLQRHTDPAITLTCKLCSDSMNFIEDAQDHLRVDHRNEIRAWFGKLNPRREFRDMGLYVTVSMPSNGPKP